ncbi:hypothetical protein, partial [Pseudomonas aeruginosa]|uniref:hypothetical protein n=1 Tax=Pseudomonas aeruginosa TaxID=287 RepID=UPI002FE03DF0
MGAVEPITSFIGCRVYQLAKAGRPGTPAKAPSPNGAFAFLRLDAGATQQLATFAGQRLGLPPGHVRLEAVDAVLDGEPAEFGKNRTLSLNAGTGRPLRLGSENEASERLRLNVPQLL